MTGLVVGGDPLLLVAHGPGLALRSGDDAVDGLLERLAVVISRPFVRAVSRAASLMTLARSAPVKPGVRRAMTLRSTSARERLALGVHREHRLAPFDVGRRYGDLPVEPAGPQQCRVEDVGTVRRGDQDDAALDVEAVHLDEHLVERLLALVVATAETRTAVPADGVDLVDEDDRRRVGLGLLEQVTHAGGADTDEHLDEVGSGDRVERHAGLAGDGPRQQRLAGSGRPVEQHALGDLGAEGLIARRVLQEVLDLLQLLDGLVGAGDVGEGRLGRVLVDEFGLAAAEAHDPVAAALHLAHDEEQHADDQQERQQAEQQATASRCSC